MNHIITLFTLHIFPRDLRHILQCLSHCIMVLLPPHALQQWVGLRHRIHLEFWWTGKGILRENFGGFGFLVWVLFPFDVAFPSSLFFGEERSFFHERKVGHGAGEDHWLCHCRVVDTRWSLYKKIDLKRDNVVRSGSVRNESSIESLARDSIHNLLTLAQVDIRATSASQACKWCPRIAILCRTSPLSINMIGRCRINGIVPGCSAPTGPVPASREFLSERSFGDVYARSSLTASRLIKHTKRDTNVSCLVIVLIRALGRLRRVCRVIGLYQNCAASYYLYRRTCLFRQDETCDFECH
jgi:hypothetical protein